MKGAKIVMNNYEWEVIVELGAEGGTIRLLGQQGDDGRWTYKSSTNEIFSLDENDEGFIENKKSHKEVRVLKPTIRNVGEVSTWEGAKAILKSFPIEHLGPISVHHEFGDRLWELIKELNVDQNKRNRWATLCFSKEVVTLSEMIRNSSHVVVLTGAGMSVESGVPDFRSRSGWWRNIDPLTVATVEALESTYDLFHEFYSVRIKRLESILPHEGHEILAKWEKLRFVQRVSTQNVDGLHFAAGSTKVDQLHGSIRTYRCNSCGIEASREQFLNKESCLKCGGKLRPNVVLFGEMLPEQDWNNALTNIQQADVVVVIGTSLQVYPVSQLPSMTNGKKVYINKEVAGGFDQLFDLVIEGSARETLMNVDQLLD